MRIQRFRDTVKKAGLLCLGVFLTAALIFSAGFSTLTVAADEERQDIELLFFSESEVSLEPSDITMNLEPSGNATIEFTVVGFEIKEADWVVSKQYLFNFAIEKLRVDVIDESHVSFTFGLMNGIDEPTEISIWMSAEGDEKPEEPNIIPEGYERGDDSIDFTDEVVYKINLKLPGANHAVRFDKNCDDDVIDMPKPTTVKYNDGYLLPEPEQYPGRAEYTFMGWSHYPDFYLPVFKDGQGYIWEDDAVLYACWEKEKGGGQDAYVPPKSDDDSDSSQASADRVVTCQMAGYPQNYAWNEAAKACQPGWLDEQAVFHPSAVSVPDTADR